jgi:hypothetical protein
MRPGGGNQQEERQVGHSPRNLDKPDPTRRWVKALMIATIVVLLIVVVMIVAGGDGGHGPSRHRGGDTPPSSVHTPPFQHQ